MRIRGACLCFGLLVAAAGQAQEIQIQAELTGRLGTATSHKGDPVAARVISPAAPQGDTLEGKVTNSKEGRKAGGESRLSFSFETLKHGGEAVPISSQVKSISNSKGQVDADENGQIICKSNSSGKAGGSAGLGRLIGAAAGGARGHAIGTAADAVADQTGLTDKYDDWFPLSCTSPFSKLLTGLQNFNRPNLTSHPHCGMGTYLYVDPISKKAVPITKFFDMPAMLREIDMLARDAAGAKIKLFTKINAWQRLRRHFRAQFAPPGLTFERFLQTLQGMTDHSYGRGQGDGSFTYKTLLVAGMHFMDAYNYDIERVKRCVIHYSAPNGMVYPFCTYNSGPCFREKIEKEFSTPLDLKAAKSAPSNGNGLVQIEN